MIGSCDARQADIIIVALDEGELELVLSGVDSEGLDLCFSINTEHSAVARLCHIYGSIQCADDTTVA